MSYKEMCPGSYVINGQVLEYCLTDDGYMIRVRDNRKKDDEMKSYVEDFKEYVSSIDDDIFLDACELFPKESGMSTHEFSELLDACIDRGKICYAVGVFRDCIRSVASDRIAKMREKYCI